MPWKVACHSIFLPYFLCLVAVLPRCLCCYHVLHLAAMPRMVENTIMFIFFPTSASFLSSTPSYFLLLFFLAWKLCHLEWDNALGFFFSQVLKEECEIILYGSNQRPGTSGCNRKSLLVWTMKSPGKKKFVVLRDQGAWGHFRVCQKVEQCAIIRVNQK